MRARDGDRPGPHPLDVALAGAIPYEYVADLITKFGSFRSTRLLLARFDTRMEEGSVLSGPRINPSDAQIGSELS